MLKRGIAVIVAIVILISHMGVCVMADTPNFDVPSIGSASAILIDAVTGEILYAKNEHVKRFPASITKIMTTLLALEKALTENGLDTVVTANAHTIAIESGSSNAGIRNGEELTVEQLLYFTMLVSGNDAANALGQYVCDGDLEAFSQLMTQRAAELGCLNTFFWNAHGLNEAPESSDKHMTTAYDMALIMKQAITIPLFVQLISTTYYEAPPTNKYNATRKYTNSCKLILKNQGEYYEYCVGGKTGWTTPAGNTLVTYAEKDGRKLICVVLKANGRAVAYADTRKLYEYGFSDNNFSVVSVMDTLPAQGLCKTVSITEQGEVVGTAKVCMDMTQSVYIPAGCNGKQLTYELICADSFEKGNAITAQITAKVPESWVVHGFGSQAITLQAQVSEITYFPQPTSTNANNFASPGGAQNNGQNVKSEENHTGTYILFIVIMIIIIIIGAFIVKYRNWRKRRKKKYWWKEYL